MINIINLLFLVVSFAILLPFALCIQCLQGLQASGFSNLTTSSCLTGQICSRFDATVTVSGVISGPFVIAQCAPATVCSNVTCSALTNFPSNPAISISNCCVYSCSTHNCNAQSGVDQVRSECNGTGGGSSFPQWTSALSTSEIGTATVIESGSQALISRLSITFIVCMLLPLIKFFFL